MDFDRNIMVVESDSGNVGVAEITGEPWAFWPTLGFSMVMWITSLFFIVPLTVIGIIVLKVKHPDIPMENFADILISNGLFLSVTTFFVAVVTIGLSILFAKIRKNISIKQYLAFNRVPVKEMAKWLGVLVLFVVCADSLTFFLGKDVASEWAFKVYDTAIITPLLWMSLIVVAPISEEIVIRGFMFEGFKSSRIGAVGAIILTSFVWACLHTQYDLYGICLIFSGGLLLGYARLKSGSIYVPLAMHALMNLIATVELVIQR